MKASGSIALRASPSDFFELFDVERYDDGSGFTAQLAVSSGHFKCSGYPFYFVRLEAFLKELQRVYDKVNGKARLEYPYEQDFIEIQVERNGSVIVSGFVAQLGLHQELRFRFECDQTFLPSLLQSVEKVLTELSAR